MTMRSRPVQAMRVASQGSDVIAPRAWEEIGVALCLAPRELQVVRGVFDDLKEFAIADDLGISPHTVHTYLDRVYRKLAVASRVELVIRIFAEFLSLTAQDRLAHFADGGGALLRPSSLPSMRESANRDG